MKLNVKKFKFIKLKNELLAHPLILIPFFLAVVVGLSLLIPADRVSSLGALWVV